MRASLRARTKSFLLHDLRLCERERVSRRVEWRHPAPDVRLETPVAHLVGHIGLLVRYSRIVHEVEHAEFHSQFPPLYATARDLTLVALPPVSGSTITGLDRLGGDGTTAADEAYCENGAAPRRVRGIRRDDMIAIRQRRNQHVEHERRRRKP